MRAGLALEKWYREAELSLLGPGEVQRIDWHGGEFSSREGGYWDTKTLVGRDNRAGDDETLRGDDD